MPSGYDLALFDEGSRPFWLQEICKSAAINTQNNAILGKHFGARALPVLCPSLYPLPSTTDVFLRGLRTRSRSFARLPDLASDLEFCRKSRRLADAGGTALRRTSCQPFSNGPL